MKSKIAIVLVFLISFLLSLVGMIFISGNWNPESLDRLLGKAESKIEDTGRGDEFDPLVQKFAERERRLDEEEALAVKREERIRMVEADLRRTAEHLELLIEQTNLSEEEAEERRAERQDRIKETVTLFERLEPEQAAVMLKDFAADEQLEILRSMKERNRADIIGAMEPNDASTVLRNLMRGAQ